MNEEEKKAIEYLEFCEPDDLVECAMYRNALNSVKNLIEKQQDKIASKNKEIKLLKDIHNKHVTIIKKQQKDIEEKINKAQYVINEYETYIKYLEERKK